jgi:hypothetical protein
MPTTQDTTDGAALKFVEPPQPGSGAGKGGRPSKWAPIVEQLSEHPGRWVLLQEAAPTPGSAGLLRRNYGLDIRIRKRTDGRFDIYACVPMTEAGAA